MPPSNSVSSVARLSRRFAQFGQSLQLTDEERDLQVRHAVIQPQQPLAELIREAGPSAVDHGLHAFVVLQAVGCQHAAFACRHELALLETERAHVADGAGTLALISAAVRVSAVFHHNQIVLSGERHSTRPWR
jgi:hypothetical protein